MRDVRCAMFGTGLWSLALGTWHVKGTEGGAEPPLPALRRQVPGAAVLGRGPGGGWWVVDPRTRSRTSPPSAPFAKKAGSKTRSPPPSPERDSARALLRPATPAHRLRFYPDCEYAVNAGRPASGRLAPPAEGDGAGRSGQLTGRVGPEAGRGGRAAKAGRGGSIENLKRTSGSVDQWWKALPRTEEPRPDASNARRQRPATRATGVSRAFACVLNTRGCPQVFCTAPVIHPVRVHTA
jgi:hypothetical protein